METQLLDLTSERCPMSLLLAKRKGATLGVNETLKICISDAGSQKDISAYFLQQGFVVIVNSQNDHGFELIVTKEKM
ncbi:sulfurtransferase TusA family protein [Vibrio sp. Of7-15]|uniref:sulfurtransferase TusA family protein n=1 Tax=Vibrio sp. Of7-15 TaxID=2724879 RepID=UPI001EF21903|nr:sulfurtransferase TusA family protein [Vibrio sp. Of7-15]MCG7498430.1 sulfurtransferase TusA family protein [Vibrio sp. Of7-15]